MSVFSDCRLLSVCISYNAKASKLDNVGLRIGEQDRNPAVSVGDARRDSSIRNCH